LPLLGQSLIIGDNADKAHFEHPVRFERLLPMSFPARFFQH